MEPREAFNVNRTGSAVLRWPVPDALNNSAAVTHRNGFAVALAARPVAEILRSYVYVSVREMRKMRDLALTKVLGRPLSGVGIELGAGCGLLSAVVAEIPTVQGIFAVEICEEMARLVMPKVAKWVLGEQVRKVVPVVGSFDDLDLPDASLDFAVEIDSLHHSDDLVGTLRECARVLKPNGTLLCFDQCQPDTLTDAQVEELLSRVYSKEFLEFNHYPLDVTLTRRENGEHEYRLREWQAAFAAAGFKLRRTVKFDRAETFKTALKGVLSHLPTSLRRLLYRGDGPTLGTTFRFIVQSIGVNTQAPAFLSPREETVFHLEKAH